MYYENYYFNLYFCIIIFIRKIIFIFLVLNQILIIKLEFRFKANAKIILGDYLTKCLN